jgi:hypothetical protein
MKEINFETIKKLPIFRNNFSEQFLQKVSLKIQEKIYGADDVIVC